MKYLLLVFKFLLGAILLLFSFIGFGQRKLEVISQTNFVSGYRVFTENDTIKLKSDSDITAVVVVATELKKNPTILTGDQSFVMPEDHDVPGNYFLSLPNPVQSVQLVTPDTDSMEVHLIKSGNIGLDLSQHRQDQTICDSPGPIVSQAEWRNGLPDPNYSRSFTDVELFVIHHSAGSNSNSNYVQVVRDIYLYHTEVNGWSDIGYNYLISQDGTLFAGRDPAGGDQLSVIGAHFCGRNSGTSGVCLLGNYETAQPSSISLSTLENLLTYGLTWKELNPLGIANHSTGIQNTISGHRDGCSTLCPGTNVYSILQIIRQNVFDKMISCGSVEEPTLSFEVDKEIARTSQLVTFTNTSSGFDSYQWVFEGGNEVLPVFNNLEENQKGIVYNNPGFYDVKLIGLRSSESDTLFAKNLMQVFRNEETLAYPNPVTHAESITIDTEGIVRFARLKNLNGQILNTISAEENRIFIPPVEPGLYLLEITENNKSYTTRIIVQ